MDSKMPRDRASQVLPCRVSLAQAKVDVGLKSRQSAVQIATIDKGLSKQ